MSLDWIEVRLDPGSLWSVMGGWCGEVASATEAKLNIWPLGQITYLLVSSSKSEKEDLGLYDL